MSNDILVLTGPITKETINEVAYFFYKRIESFNTQITLVLNNVETVDFKTTIQLVEFIRSFKFKNLSIDIIGDLKDGSIAFLFLDAEVTISNFSEIELFIPIFSSPGEVNGSVKDMTDKLNHVWLDQYIDWILDYSAFTLDNLDAAFTKENINKRDGVTIYTTTASNKEEDYPEVNWS